MAARESVVEVVEPGAWPDLVAWLDDGLRRGLRGTLQREYALSLEPADVGRHRIVRRGGRLAAHAMFHRVRVCAAGTALDVGLIGLVYTDPAARGLGLASRCVEACVEAIRGEGCSLAMLWSDKPGFYARLDFWPVGREALLVADAACLGSARCLPGPMDLEVGPARADDFGVLERLYARKPTHVSRPPGALAQLAQGPGIELVVARCEAEPVAYAALGRGDDFHDVIHEWAGEPSAVLGCFEVLRGERQAVGVLSSPALEPPTEALLDSGALAHPRPFALARLLDARTLLRAVTGGQAELAGVAAAQDGEQVTFEASAGSRTLPTRQVLDLLLGSALPGTAPGASDADGLEALASCLSPDERSALAKRLPWPLYVWGFDSI